MDHKSSMLAPSRRSDPRMDRTRAALHSTFLALLDERPLEEITVREITLRAGCGYATFFRHYPDKAALLDSIAESEVAAVFRQILPILSGSSGQETTRMLCFFIQERWELWRALLTGGATGQVRQAFLAQATLAAKAVPQRDGPPSDLVIGVGVASALEVLGWWLRRGRKVPAAEVAGYLDRLVIGPIRDAKRA